MGNSKVGIMITGNAALQLKERAKFLGCKAEELANRIVEQYLKENADETIEADDERYVKAAVVILRRNSKLYRRLA